MGGYIYIYIYIYILIKRLFVLHEFLGEERDILSVRFLIKRHHGRKREGYLFWVGHNDKNIEMTNNNIYVCIVKREKF